MAVDRVQELLDGLRQVLQGRAAGMPGPAGPAPLSTPTASRQLAQLGAQQQPAGATGQEWQQTLAQMRGQLQAQQKVQQNVPAGADRGDWLEATMKVEKRLYEEKQKQLRAAQEKTARELEIAAYMQRTGASRREAVQAVPASAEGGGNYLQTQLIARLAAHSVASTTQQALDFNRPTGGNEMAQAGRAGTLLQTAFGGLSGPLGIAANLAGGFGQAISAVGEAFKQYEPTLAETNALLRERAALQSGARRTGAPTAEDLHAAFQGAGAMGNLQDPNLNTQQRADFLRQMRTASQQEVTQLAGRHPEVGRAALEDLLMEMRGRARAGQGQGNRLQRMEALLEQYQIRQQDRPVELEQFQPGFAGGAAPARNMTDQQIRALAESTMTGPLRQAQARVETSGAVLRGGVLPNLRPGAPQLADLPNLFRSQQSDVLSMHAQVQQEAIRDQRQEMQFQASIRLWEQILGAIQANRFTPPAVIGDD